MQPLRLRVVLAVAAEFGVAWLGAHILGEYPFGSVLSMLGGLLLGLTVVGAAAFVLRGDPPVWVIVVGAAFALWGEWRAAWIDAGGIGPLTWHAWVAVAAAGVGALARLIPPRSAWKRENAG